MGPKMLMQVRANPKYGNFVRLGHRFEVIANTLANPKP